MRKGRMQLERFPGRLRRHLIRAPWLGLGNERMRLRVTRLNSKESPRQPEGGFFIPMLRGPAHDHPNRVHVRRIDAEGHEGGPIDGKTWWSLGEYSAQRAQSSIAIHGWS